MPRKELDPADFDELADYTLVTRDFAETILDLSPGTLANWTFSGKDDLDQIKIGKNVRIQIGELRSYLKRSIL